MDLGVGAFLTGKIFPPLLTSSGMLPDASLLRFLLPKMEGGLPRARKPLQGAFGRFFGRFFNRKIIPTPPDIIWQAS
jgi:hypothetical protein